MNYLREASDKLRKHKARQAALERLNDQLNTIEMELLWGPRAVRTDATPVQGGGNGWEEATLNRIAERDELRRQGHIVRNKVLLVSRALEALDEEDRKVLELFYVDRPTDYITRLCQLLHVEKAQVYKRKDQALRNFAISLYGDVES